MEANLGMVKGELKQDAEQIELIRLCLARAEYELSNRLCITHLAQARFSLDDLIQAVDQRLKREAENE